MNRRVLSPLATLAALLFAGIVCLTAHAELINITPGGGGSFSVTAKKQDVMIAGKTVHAMIYEDDNNPLNVATYANGIPVLVMRLTAGQMVTCKFTNKLPNGEVPEGASIHWHGIELDNDSDGTGVTQDSVLENQSYTYRFIAPRPGIFWFHSHMVPGDTLFAGMYGVIIVQSSCEAQMLATNGLPAATATWPLAMSDIEWDTRTTITNDDMTVSNNPTLGKVGKVSGGVCKTINEWIHDCGQLGPGGSGSTGNGQQGICQTASYPGKVVLVNGYNPDVDMKPAFSVQSGQMIRLQLLNEALTRSFYLELEKTNNPPLIRIGGQGGLLNYARVEGGIQNGWNTLYDRGAIVLSSGMRSDVVITIPAGLPANTQLKLYGLPLDMTGTQWPLMAEITNAYPIAYFNVTGPFGGVNPPITTNSALLTGTNCMVPNLASGPVTLKTNFISPVPYGPGMTSGKIRLTSAGPAPSIDGVNIINPGTYPNGNPLDGNFGNGDAWRTPRLPTTRYAYVGDTLQMVITNQTGGMSALAHPFHMHGFSFQPVSMIDGAGAHPFGYEEFMDTIDVYSGQALVCNVRFDDRQRFCDSSSGTGIGQNAGPVLAPCSGGAGGALGRWLYHCHIAAHGVLGMMGEIIVLGNTQQPMTLQPPDTSTNGVDVLATLNTGSQTVADDFLWQDPGPITHVRIWGSWKNDLIDPNAAFELKFWTDVPAFNGKPSRPGWQAWEQIFPPGAYTNFVYANPPFEGFYDPSLPLYLPMGDSLVVQYDFDLTNATAPYYPPPGSPVNWLSVTAYPTLPGAFFGWKSCLVPYQWNDDATWSPTLWGPHWTDLHYPFGHQYYPLNQSMDMSFQLFVAGVAPGTHSLSSVAPATQPTLSASNSGGQFSISWSGTGTLQYADDLAGPWTDIPNAANPYPVPTDVARRFYRVRTP